MRSRLIKSLNNRFYVKFMQLEIGLLTARSNYRYEENVVGFEKALGAVKMIKDQIQCRCQSLLNLAHGYFSVMPFLTDFSNM